MIEHSTPFTANELVLLNGQHFASESGWFGESICLLVIWLRPIGMIV